MTRALTSQTVLAIFTAMLIILASTVSGVTVGVQMGDWAKYGDFSASWSSNIPGQTMPPEFEELNKTEWTKVTVQSVSNSSVTVQAVIHFKNGTEKTETMSGDIATGSGNLTFFLIPANLGAGDTIPGGIPITGTLPYGISPKINDTLTKTYAGAQREVDHIGYHVSIIGTTMDFNIYWDKAKGILCELAISMSMSIMGYTTSQTMQMKIKETNMWGGGIIPGLPDYILFAIIAIVVIAIIVVAAVSMMRRRKPPTPSTPTITGTEPSAPLAQ